jgi:hypothetical protein
MSEARRATATVSFLTAAEALAKLLPPRCELFGEPVVTVEHAELLKLDWLAGRSYSLMGVKFPVRYRGGEEAIGPFLSVLWENRPEPILTGREELGFAKLYCELPARTDRPCGRQYRAEWDGHVFASLDLDDLAPAPSPTLGIQDGVLHHRYFPAVDGDGADVDAMVLSPRAASPPAYDRFERGRGRVEFISSTWEQLPTMFHIVNILAALPMIEERGGTYAETRGSSDLSDQRTLK